ncbi:hypothetical protein GCM10010466_07260 [Planomonospora alba]|uniref:Uncharacterized protein n=1 Tax=Planomonospora alba TaxID=161354 RepID=A0ABP6MN32_9ACTN
MGFFDVGQSRAQQQEFDRAAWRGPSDDVQGVVIPIGKLIATSHHVAVVLKEIVAHPDGCLFEVEAVARRMGMKERKWDKLSEALSDGPQSRDWIDEQDLAQAIRFGVSLSNGRKATTLDERHWDDDEPPQSPYLMKYENSSIATTDDDEFERARYGLWLWPLPPEEDFHFVTEWPLAGIPLTFSDINGSMIGEWARQAKPYWT